MREQITQLVCRCIERENQLLAQPVDLSAGAQTPLFGENGQLDSMSLVALIVGIEQEIESEFGASVILADERAMSSRRSPFATLASLVEHVQGLLEAQECRAPSR